MTSLNTMGAGTQNLMSIFLMFSLRFFESRQCAACSSAEPPSVGSGAPCVALMSEILSLIHFMKRMR